MSKIQVDTIDTRSGTSTMTIGSTNTTTIALKSGATLTNFPVTDVLFAATINNNQSLSHEVMTKLTFDTEIYDVGTCYDHSSNYRFTVPSGKGGYYHVGGKVCFEASANTKQMIAWLKFKKNGSDTDLGGAGTNQPDHYNNGSASGHRNIMTSTDFIINLSAGDYIEAFGQQGHDDSSASNARADYSLFWGYKLIT